MLKRRSTSLRGTPSGTIGAVTSERIKADTMPEDQREAVKGYEVVRLGSEISIKNNEEEFTGL